MIKLSSRNIAYGMLCIQLPLFIYFFKAFSIPIVAVGMGGIAFSSKFRVKATDRVFTYASIALVLVMYLIWNAFPPRAEQFASVSGTVGILVTQYFIVLQATMLLWERKGGLPKLYPLAGGLTLMFLGDRGGQFYRIHLLPRDDFTLCFLVCLVRACIAETSERWRVLGVGNYRVVHHVDMHLCRFGWDIARCVSIPSRIRSGASPVGSPCRTSGWNTFES